MEEKKLRGRPKTKTPEELAENKKLCQKKYMEKYQRDYHTIITCSCGLNILKCNLSRHRKSNYHKKYDKQE